MTYEEMFNKLDAGLPRNDNSDVDCGISSYYEPRYHEQTPPMNWEETFSGFKTTPVLYNLDGFISPYASNNWGGTSNILQYIDDSSRLPALENKIDPNKIFSSEINALRALAADQQKITKMFEKKLIESLTERGKVGLTEEDVEAMSALTAARSAITSISKEQVNIKKNIADIRVKQSQSAAGNAGNGSGNTGGNKALGNMDIGRSILDNIFDAPASPVVPQTVVDYQPSSANDAGRILDNIVSPTNSQLMYESVEPTTYVVVGETDDDVEFATYNASGDLIPDFPNPAVKITSIDRDAGKATDEFLVQYPIKTK